MKLHNDAELVSLFHQGNESAFAELVRRHKSRIFTTIYLILRDKEQSEDLFQEAFIKAFHKMKAGQYNEEGKFLPWMVRIAHNLAIDQIRKNKRYPHTPLEERSPVNNSLDWSEESAETQNIRGENEALMRRLIQELPENQREVVLMRHFAEMSFQEIADATGVSINTALGRMRYALINLRKMLALQNNAYDTNLYRKQPAEVPLRGNHPPRKS